MRKLILLVGILLFLIGCSGGKTAEKPLPVIGEQPNETQPEAPPPVNETPAEVPVNETPVEPEVPENVTPEAPAEENLTEEPVLNETPPEEPAEEPIEGVGVTALSQKTIWIDPANPDNYTKIENVSLFLDVQCAIGTSAEESGYVANTQQDDFLSFTFHNKDSHEFYIPIMKPKDSPTSEGVKLMINGRRIPNADELCGSNYVKGDEKLTCKEVKTVLKSGKSVRGQQLTNKLETTTRYYKSELIFTC